MIARERARTVARDGHCRLADTPGFGPCHIASEWAHLEGKRRYKTRGLPPEQRHSTAWSAMLCKWHHDAYDAHDIECEAVTSRGANGPLRWSRETGGVTVSYLEARE